MIQSQTLSITINKTERKFQIFTSLIRVCDIDVGWFHTCKVPLQSDRHISLTTYLADDRIIKMKKINEFCSNCTCLISCNSYQVDHALPFPKVQGQNPKLCLIISSLSYSLQVQFLHFVFVWKILNTSHDSHFV